MKKSFKMLTSFTMQKLRKVRMERGKMMHIWNMSIKRHLREDMYRYIITIYMYIHVHYKAMKFGFIMLNDKHVFLLQMCSWNGKRDKENVNKQ